MGEIINTFVFPVVRREFILTALDSLKKMTPPNYHVIVVDQTQPHLLFESELRAQCDLWVKARKNYGFAQACNLGIRLAPTEYVTVCNCDVEFVWPYWWQGIEETFKRYETAVCVNPMSPKEPGWGYGEEGYRYHLTYEQSKNPRRITKLVKEKNGQMIDGLVCWCSVFKRDVLVSEVGLFDERHFPGEGEDYDMMGRLYLAGYRALSTSLSWVWHWWGQSKDEPDGLTCAEPPARERWNRLDILWPDGFDVWGRNPETQEPLRRLPEIARMPL